MAESISREFTVQNKMGIHARPAAMIVRIANRHPSVELEVEKDGERVNGKSIMGLMMLAAGHGVKLLFEVSGNLADGEKMLNEIEKLFDGRFDEE